MKLSDYVRLQSVVSIASVKKFLGCNSTYASLVLRRLVSRGVLRKVTRNKYTASSNIYEIATNLFTPSYLSFWSASQYYGYTEQILSMLQIVTTKPHKDIHFEGYTFTFLPFPKKYFFGYSKIPTSHGFLFIAEREKLLLDVLLRPKEIGNFDEVLKIFKQTDVKKETIISLLKTAGSASLTKRVGFFLDQYKGIDISRNISFKDKNYVSAAFFHSRAKTTVSKWRIKI